MIAGLPQDLRARSEAYRDGINAWIAHVGRARRTCPASSPRSASRSNDWTLRDTARVGVFLARTVPSGDGVELENAEALAHDRRRTTSTPCTRCARPGRRITVPKEEGKFPAQPGRTQRDERTGFRRTREFLHETDLSSVTNTIDAVLERAGVPLARRARAPTCAGSSPAPAARSCGRSPTGNARAYQFNGPQLGFSIPELFVEFELHTPDLPSIRGVSAAGIPIVGIGHNGDVAWGFTSGLSDEDDLYVEERDRRRDLPVQGRASGRWTAATRSSRFRPRPPTCPDLIEAPGPPAGAVTERICRTVHGPVQYTGDGVALARRYAIWGRELETFVGLDMLNHAKTIDDVDAAMQRGDLERERDRRRRLAATSATGTRACTRCKPKRWDERLPFPGDRRGRVARAPAPPPDARRWSTPSRAGWPTGTTCRRSAGRTATARRASG